MARLKVAVKAHVKETVDGVEESIADRKGLRTREIIVGGAFRTDVVESSEIEGGIGVSAGPANISFRRSQSRSEESDASFTFSATIERVPTLGESSPTPIPTTGPGPENSEPA